MHSGLIPLFDAEGFDLWAGIRFSARIRRDVLLIHPAVRFQCPTQADAGTRPPLAQTLAQSRRRYVAAAGAKPPRGRREAAAGTWPPQIGMDSPLHAVPYAAVQAAKQVQQAFYSNQFSSFRGKNSAIPSKSFMFRVTRIKLYARAVAAICES